MWIRSLLVLAVMVSPVTAQDSLDIEGEFEVDRGQLVRLDADIDEAESPFWIVLKPTTLDYEQVNDGSRIVFAVPCDADGEIIVMLLAQRISEDGRIITRQVRQTIEIRGPPIEDPIIEDGPVDETPPSAFSQAITREVRSIGAPSNLLDAVADNFDQVADNAASNVYPDARTLSIDLSKKNSSSVSPAGLVRWQSFSSLVQTELKRLSEAGHFPRIADHAPMLRVIATAIRSAK